MKALLLLLQSLSVLWNKGFVSALRCYCTEDHCSPYGFCEAEWCVVGIRKSSGEVIRSCGTDNAAMLQICKRELGDWLDLCSCRSNFCNTYAFLRMQIRASKFMLSKSEAADSMPQFVVGGGTQITAEDADDAIVFGRVEAQKPADRLSNRRHPNTKSSRRPVSENAASQSFVILLLVIVPLVVGGGAVLLVAANYYCHLC